MQFLNHTLLQSKLCAAMIMAMANLLCTASALAEPLKDPTKPPAILNSESSLESETPAVPMLQSIMIGPQTHAAIINGEKVLLGKKYQSATLIKLNEHEAILRYPDMSEQILSMDFAMRKKLVTPVFNTHSNQPKAKHQPKQITKPIEVSEK